MIVLHAGAVSKCAVLVRYVFTKDVMHWLTALAVSAAVCVQRNALPESSRWSVKRNEKTLVRLSLDLFNHLSDIGILQHSVRLDRLDLFYAASSHGYLWRRQVFLQQVMRQGTASCCFRQNLPSFCKQKTTCVFT